MKNKNRYYILAAILLFPAVSFAALDGLTGLLKGTLDVINLLIPVVFGVGVLYFFWGLGQFILHDAGNEKTREEGDITIPVIITIYEDRTFSFILKKPPVADLIVKTLKIAKGSDNSKKTKVGKLNQAQLTEIAETKMNDLNANDIEAAMKIVAGTARSMGVDVK